MRRTSPELALIHFHDSAANTRRLRPILPPKSQHGSCFHLSQVQEIKDIGVPGLQVHGKGALTLASTLIDVTSLKRAILDYETVSACH